MNIFYITKDDNGKLMYSKGGTDLHKHNYHWTEKQSSAKLWKTKGAVSNHLTQYNISQVVDWIVNKVDIDLDTGSARWSFVYASDWMRGNKL